MSLERNTMQNMLSWIIPLLPAFGIVVLWNLIRKQHRLGFTLAVLFWFGSHAIFFFMPGDGYLGDIGSKIGITLGIIVSLCYGGFTIFSLKNQNLILCITVWATIPLTLIGTILLRDIPSSEQRSHCYIKSVGNQMEKFYQNNDRYPFDLYGDSFGGNQWLLSLENACDTTFDPPWYSSFPRTLLLYQRQGNTYVLGGYYSHWLLQDVGLTRVCHYNQATKDVTCGFNNWAPFAPQ